MNQLKRYLDDTGRSPEEVAVDLSALMGKKIGTGAVLLWSRRPRPPQAWADALSLPESIDDEAAGGRYLDDDEPLGGHPSGEEEGLLRDDAQPPTAPLGTQVHRTPPAVSGRAAAKQRLEMAYNAIGAGATLITENKGYEAVASHYAPSLADGWLRAAETNATVAKIVAFMESGGPVGELVVGHFILLLGFGYVSGRGPQLDFLYGRFQGHRAAAVAAETIRQTEAHLNGSGQHAAEDRVGDPPS